MYLDFKNTADCPSNLNTLKKDKCRSERSWAKQEGHPFFKSRLDREFPSGTSVLSGGLAFWFCSFILIWGRWFYVN